MHWLQHVKSLHNWEVHTYLLIIVLLPKDPIALNKSHVYKAIFSKHNIGNIICVRVCTCKSVALELGLFRWDFGPNVLLKLSVSSKWLLICCLRFNSTLYFYRSIIIIIVSPHVMYMLFMQLYYGALHIGTCILRCKHTHTHTHHILRITTYHT